MLSSEKNNPDREKTILFLCKCASHVSNHVDFPSIIKWSKHRQNADIVAVSNLLCAPKGKDFFAKNIKDKNIKNIVVAACSPKLHEKTFQDIAQQQGVNIAKVQMANIREQCAWVTDDVNQATLKAKSIINATLERSGLASNLEPKSMKANSNVLIIGGGISGMQAALNLANPNRKVYIVEKEISLGGWLIKTEELAPNMECSPCLLAPMLADIRDHEHIEVITHAEIEEILGFFGNFTARIRKKARYIEDNCIGCEECFAVCPVDRLSAFHEGLGSKKAIYTEFPGSVPAAAAIDASICLHFSEEACQACVPTCPFGSINFEHQDEMVSIDAGAILIATGLKHGSLENFPHLAHRQLDNVYTLPEFERLVSSNGPSGGNLVLKNGQPPQNIAVLHCAGSLTEHGLPYCSGICCSNALKVADLARKQIPDIKVRHYYHDLVLPSPSTQDFFQHQKQNGTEFVFSEQLSQISIHSSGKEQQSLELRFGDQSLYQADLVVLVTGIQGVSQNQQLATMLGITADKNNYLTADHPLLRNTRSQLDGIYMAGCALAPANVSQSITQSGAVAADIVSKLIPGQEIALEMLTSYIDPEQCAGCKLCIAACPYKAIHYLPDKKISEINEAICRGCGTCTAACPSGASTARHFSDQEIYAEIGGMLYA